MSDQQENVSMNVSEKTSSAPATASTAAAASANTIADRDVPAPLSLLVNVRNIFDIMTQRGVFKPTELKGVGIVYENLTGCITNALKVTQSVSNEVANNTSEEST